MIPPHDSKLLTHTTGTVKANSRQDFGKDPARVRTLKNVVATQGS